MYDNWEKYAFGIKLGRKFEQFDAALSIKTEKASYACVGMKFYLLKLMINLPFTKCILACLFLLNKLYL